MNAITQKQETRIKVELIIETVMRELNWSQYDYNNFIYEMGIFFLNKQYPEHTSKFYFDNYTQSRGFWLWFQNEWNFWQQDYFKFVKAHNARITKKIIYGEANSFLTDVNTVKSFQCYISLLDIYSSKTTDSQ